MQILNAFNQPQNDPHNPNVLFKQIPIAKGFYLISPIGKQYYSNSGLNCVSCVVNVMFNLEQMASDYFKTNIPLSRVKDCNGFAMGPQEEEQFEESTISLAMRRTF